MRQNFRKLFRNSTNSDLETAELKSLLSHQKCAKTNSRQSEIFKITPETFLFSEEMGKGVRGKGGTLKQISLRASRVPSPVPRGVTAKKSYTFSKICQGMYGNENGNTIVRR